MNINKQFFSLAICIILLMCGMNCKPNETTTDTTPTEEMCYVETVKTNGFDAQKIEYDAQHRATKYSFYYNASGNISTLYGYYDFAYI